MASRRAPRAPTAIRACPTAAWTWRRWTRLFSLPRAATTYTPSSARTAIRKAIPRKRPVDKPRRHQRTDEHFTQPKWSIMPIPGIEKGIHELFQKRLWASCARLSAGRGRVCRTENQLEVRRRAGRRHHVQLRRDESRRGHQGVRRYRAGRDGTDVRHRRGCRRRARGGGTRRRGRGGRGPGAEQGGGRAERLQHLVPRPKDRAAARAPSGRP